ncbi:MAG: DUF2971 domain-containing protein [Janthinobacterium lividum]
MIQRLKKNFNELEFVKHHSKLFKYRKWKDHIYDQKVLLANELYFPEPETFNNDNDPNDCIISLKKLSQLEIEVGLSNFYKKQHPRYNDSAIIKIVQNHLKFHFKDYEALDKRFKQEDKAFDKKMGVLCLTHDPLNYKMWEQYGDNYTGICYGFKSVNLYNDLSKNSPVTAGKVLYSTPKPEWNPFDQPEINVFRRIYCKDSKYKFEKEYRLKKTSVVNRISHFQDSTLECIFLGASMAEADKVDIIKIIKDRNLTIKVYQCAFHTNNQLSYFQI